jgi:hypothetical protein
MRPNAGDTRSAVARRHHRMRCRSGGGGPAAMRRCLGCLRARAFRALGARWDWGAASCPSGEAFPRRERATIPTAAGERSAGRASAASALGGPTAGRWGSWGRAGVRAARWVRAACSAWRAPAAIVAALVPSGPGAGAPGVVRRRAPGGSAAGPAAGGLPARVSRLERELGSPRDGGGKAGPGARAVLAPPGGAPVPGGRPRALPSSRGGRYATGRSPVRRGRVRRRRPADPR